MSKGEWHPCAVALAALYLRGGPGSGEAPASAWPRLLAHLRLELPTLPRLSASLAQAGFWYEGSLLDSPGRLSWAEGALARGACLTAACPDYPRGWLSRLGGSAPPALWASAPLPPGPSVALVGSRSLTARQSSFARSAGAVVAALGSSFVSGGASGSDTLGLQGFLQAGCPSRAVIVLPYGVNLAPSWLLQTGVAIVSPFAPDTPFSGRQAMERNILIHAHAGNSIVAASRFQSGGTWHGCREAARRRLSWLAVADWHDKAARALAVCGGTLIDPSADILPQLRWVIANDSVTPDPTLFGAQRVREARAPYAFVRNA